MPQSILTSRYKPVDDNDKHLQEVGKQPDQPCFACEPSESGQTPYDHICPNNPILTCNCADPKYCAELGSDPDGTSTKTEGTRAEEGRTRSEDGSPAQDGFSDNINYTGIPVPTPKRESAKRGWPCVVVGAIPETWIDASKCISGSEHSAGHIEQHTDAGLNNDGPVTTNGL
jgi:hypothetical protein